MTRINVYAAQDPTDPDAEVVLEGFFYTDKARCIDENTEWNGNNNIGVISGLQVGYEELYRTAKGRWVRHYNARNEFNGPEYYEFITDEQAREWLLRNGSDDIVTEYFGEIEEERGPGRAVEGVPISTRFRQDQLDAVDARAKAQGKSRADILRDMVDQCLTMTDATA